MSSFKVRLSRLRDGDHLREGDFNPGVDSALHGTMVRAERPKVNSFGTRGIKPIVQTVRGWVNR